MPLASLSEAQWHNDVLRLASANGWKLDIEDCQPKLQPTTYRAICAIWPTLKKALTFLFGRQRMEFNLVYHTYDSRKSGSGFPDLVMVHPRRGLIAFVELKTDTGTIKPAQRMWYAGLLACVKNNPSTLVAIWRPRDRAAVVNYLGGIDL